MSQVLRKSHPSLEPDAAGGGVGFFVVLFAAREKRAGRVSVSSLSRAQQTECQWTEVRVAAADYQWEKPDVGGA